MSYLRKVDHLSFRAVPPSSISNNKRKLRYIYVIFSSGTNCPSKRKHHLILTKKNSFQNLKLLSWEILD